jgi:hypothetical protein
LAPYLIKGAKNDKALHRQREKSKVKKRGLLRNPNKRSRLAQTFGNILLSRSSRGRSNQAWFWFESGHSQVTDLGQRTKLDCPRAMGPDAFSRHRPFQRNGPCLKSAFCTRPSHVPISANRKSLKKSNPRKKCFCGPLISGVTISPAYSRPLLCARRGVQGLGSNGAGAKAEARANPNDIVNKMAASAGDIVTVTMGYSAPGKRGCYSRNWSDRAAAVAA